MLGEYLVADVDSTPQSVSSLAGAGMSAAESLTDIVDNHLNRQ